MLWVPPITKVGAILTEGEISGMGKKPVNCQKVALGIVSMGKIVEIPLMPLLSHVTSIRRTESPFVINTSYLDISVRIVDRRKLGN